MLQTDDGQGIASELRNAGGADPCCRNLYRESPSDRLSTFSLARKVLEKCPPLAQKTPLTWEMGPTLALGV
jgi:hypothetical protein